VRQSIVGKAYAETLFALGDRHGQLEAFAAALGMLTALLDADPRIRRFVETPKIDAHRKKAAIARVLEGHVPPLFLNFVGVVFDKRRELLLPAIAHEYAALLDAHLGRVRAHVTLARRPTEESESAIIEQLSRTLGKQVVPSVRIDENILGGIVVRYGDRMLDGSLRRRLLALRNRLRYTSVPAAAGP
jgi:F-type H+-transporting ATPase subunit delta